MKTPLNSLEAYCIIVNCGQANKVLKYAKKYGITGGTVFLGLGTSKHSKILNFLDLTDMRKEILLMLVDQETVRNSFDAVATKFKFHKANHGIAFTMPVSQILGSHLYPGPYSPHSKESDSMFKAIFIIVDRGKAEDVMVSANKAGARGGTIINARGSGIHETTKVFNMEISPEKEVVLILANQEDTKNITNQIIEDLDINKPGNGIIFVQDINQAYGLH